MQCRWGAARMYAIHRLPGFTLPCLGSYAFAQRSFGNEDQAVSTVQTYKQVETLEFCYDNGMSSNVKSWPCRGGTFPGWPPSTF